MNNNNKKKNQDDSIYNLLNIYRKSKKFQSL